MGSGNHVVVDVSSDEEVDTRVDRDNFDWLNDIMETVDEKSDSTDVVEVFSEVKDGIYYPYRKINSSIQAVENDDDDCVILEGDPDKTPKNAAVDDGDKLAKNDDDDDDVLVVGQKGEIACRDFPHPRHSCAKYSFNSTSHEKYCDMCHCYVCDIRAPCPYWCIGVSSINHCHANDTEKIWKNQRQYFRAGNMPTQPSSKPAATVTRQFSRSPTQNIFRLSDNALPRNPVGIRPCSSSSRVPNARARYRIKQSIPQNQSYELQNRPVQSLSSVRNNVIQKDRSSYMGNLRSRMTSSGTLYGATNGSNIKVGVYTNSQVSESTHHSSCIVAPTIHPEMYNQQEVDFQPNVTNYSAAVRGSQSNVYTKHSSQNKSGSGDFQFQANADLFDVPETSITTAYSQAQTFQQQPGSNENALQTKLSEFESWLMDSSNQTGLVNPSPDPACQDYVSPLTFDFESYLND